MFNEGILWLIVLTLSGFKKHGVGDLFDSIVSYKLGWYSSSILIVYLVWHLGNNIF